MSNVSAGGDNATALLWLFAGLAIVLLPFNAMPYFRETLGEMAYEGAFYPLAAGIVLWAGILLAGARVELPSHYSARLLLVFVAWVFVSALINAPGVIAAATKGRTGMEKFLLQALVVLFTAASSVLLYNVFVRSRAVLYTVRRWLLASFAVCGAYSVLEIGRLLGVPMSADALALIDRFIRDPDNLLAYSEIGRLRSVSGEASWFAMYCALVTPWILSYLFTEQKLKWWFLPVLVYLLVLITLTWSRAAYVITVLEFVTFAIAASLLIPDPAMRARARTTAVLTALIFVGAAGITVVIFDEQVFMQRSLIDIFASLLDTDNLSNVGRVGSQVTAMRMAFDSPMFGVGFGQYGFHMSEYVPSWALSSEEMSNWMSSSADAPWAPVQGIYSRIAAESGLAGLVIWVTMWGATVYAVYQRVRRINQSADGAQALGLALLVSIVGVLLCGFIADSLRFFGYWIVLALAWTYITEDGQAGQRGA